MPTAAITDKGGATRQAIIDTARSLLVEEGYERLAMRKVAVRCGIKLGNLQYYFATREALLTTIFEMEAEKDIATINASVDEKEDADALRAIVTDLFSRWRGESGVVFATLNLLMQHNDTYRTVYQRIYRNFYAATEAAIQCALPGLDDAECALRARMLTALVDGATMQMGVSRKPAFRERLIEEACRIALSK